jgi:hypothetical protein
MPRGTFLSFCTRDISIILLSLTYLRTVDMVRRSEDSSLMHKCSKDCVVHHQRICVRYVGSVPRHTLINYNGRTLIYGPRVAMASSQSDDPKAFYIKCYKKFLIGIILHVKSGGAANALLLLSLKLRSG